MSDDFNTMKDADMPLLDRVEAALDRITNRQGLMRIPGEATDIDVVVLDCRDEIKRLRAELAAANARLAVSMEAHQITISGTVASLLHTITLTREAAGCRDGDNLPAFVGVMRRLIDAVEAMGYEWRWTKSIDENGEQVGAWHGENSPILMEPIEDKNDTISRLKRENIKLLLRIAEYEAREH